jgi:glyoxylate reductase
MMLGSSLEGRVLGVVGFGRIGQALARKTSCLGMRVIFSDSIERTDSPHEQVELETLLRHSDVISLHCPLLSETYHLIGAEELAAMKQTAVLINTARGPVIDEAALCDALRTGEIGGAGLDVFEHEPAVTAELLRFENVVLAPHLGSATNDVREAMGELCVSALRAVLLERTMPKNAVNAKQLG